MAKFEHFEKYDMLVCFINAEEDADEASELYFQRYGFISKFCTT